jgi:hypothetical protein
LPFPPFAFLPSAYRLLPTFDKIKPCPQSDS